MNFGAGSYQTATFTRLIALEAKAVTAVESSSKGLRQASVPTARVAVSVVIPTFHRDGPLRRCLEAIASQDLPADAYEIIVIDDARSPTTPGVIDGVRARCPWIQITLISGRGQGPATARNAGWRGARGEIIAFTDDDAYPAKGDWLRQGLAPFADPAVTGVCGTVRTPACGPRTDFQRNVQQLERGGFITCNVFYRRSALEAIEGFDERFTAPYREDSDLQFRIESCGRLLYNPELAVVHPAPAGSFAASLRLQRHSMFNALIYKKHPRRYRKELQRWPPLHYYAINGFALASLLAAACRRSSTATGCLFLWALFDTTFFLRRSRGVSHRPLHLLDLALTSLLIPPVSIYWRLRGAIRFRVLFI